MRLRHLLLSALLVLPACGDGSSGPSRPSPNGDIRDITIEVGDLVFDAREAGPADGEPVLLLHGFPSTSWEWKDQLRALGLAGYRVVAPNQRGYSPGARPEAVEEYGIALLVADVLGMANALGFDRFHLVGHDWGAAVTWGVGIVAPDRILTLNPVSVPHPDAFAKELADPSSCQYQASGYFDFFVQPGTADVFVANDAAFLRSIFDGVPAADVDVHVATLGNREAMDAALNWYRANVSERGILLPQEVGPVSTPTMFVWSDADVAICREGAEATADYVDGPYRFEVLEGVNHWIPENAGDRLSELLLDHLG